MALNTVLAISTLLINATADNSANYNDLIETTVTIVKSCTSSKQISALLLAGEYDDFLQKSLLDDVPVALISESDPNNFEYYTLTRYLFREFRKFATLQLLWKMNEFVVVARSQPLLRLLLQRIKDSTWFNSNGFYVLIDRKTGNYGCSNAYRFLWVAWEYELLSTIFLCIDPVEGLLIYTYNPYTNVIPSEWQDAGSFKGRNRHPWLLLKKKYRNGPGMCKDLNFDKTSDLNGYEVRANAVSYPPNLYIDPEGLGVDKKFAGENGEIIQMVFRKLNASLNVMVHNGSVYDLGGLGPHGNIVGMFADIESGKVDMGINARTLYVMWKFGTTYPHGQNGLCVITQRAGQVSELTKVISFMSVPVIFGNLTVFIIAFWLLVKYKGVLPAALDIIRLMTVVSIHRLPRSISTRVFFVNVFILILIMNSLLQSHLASLLTVPVFRPNIKTPADLKRANSTIYGSKFQGPSLQDPVLRSRFHPVSYHECEQRVRNSIHAACLDDCNHQYTRIRSNSHTFYNSRAIQQNLQVYVTKQNWSLLNPMTRLIQNAVEAGIVSMWKNVSRLMLRRAWKKRIAREFRSYRTLTMKNVGFCFYVQVIGFILGTVAFLFEILIARYKPRLMKIHETIRDREEIKKLQKLLNNKKRGTSEIV
ncbi:uncharacterized protein LOC114881670 [Osmia bicornis bicornis]|uniref:uncharacterized protein LOC114881670 n=1 Tax=Osmia bicornis bicornis TaxID=1437191 RepID=UPI001EAF7BF0|nr:uncharacterized protein LOC114881670 [Osmia bicornis bicornis]